MALRPTSPQIAAENAELRERAQQDVFRREVDEAVRQDTMATFFRRWGKLLIALAVVLVVALGAWSWWHHKQTAEAEQDAVDLTLALDQLEAGNIAAAAEQAAALREDGVDAGYRVPAQFLAANAALNAGKTADAVKIFDAIAADEGNPQPMRDLATVRSVAAQYDDLEPQAVIDRLKPLAVPGNAYYPSAGELTAMAYVEQGKNEQAGPIFAEIAKNEDAPDTLRARARQMAGLMGTDAVEDPEAIAEMIQQGGAGQQAR